MDQVNYTAQKAWKDLHYLTRVLKKEIGIQNLAHTSSVRPVLECGAACWDSCREGQINALDRVQKKPDQFSNHTKGSDWETLAHRRTIARLWALFRTYSGERAWKVIGNRL